MTISAIDTTAASVRGALVRYVDDAPVLFEFLDLVSILVDRPADLEVLGIGGRCFSNFLGDEQRRFGGDGSSRDVPLPKAGAGDSLVLRVSAACDRDAAEASALVSGLVDRIERCEGLWERAARGFHGLVGANRGGARAPRIGRAEVPPSTLSLATALWSGIFPEGARTLKALRIPFEFLVRVGDGTCWTVRSWDGTTPPGGGAEGVEFIQVPGEAVGLPVLRAISTGIVQLDRRPAEFSVDSVDLFREVLIPIHYGGAPWALLRISVPGDAAGWERLHDFYRYGLVIGPTRDAIRTSLMKVLRQRLGELRLETVGDHREALEKVWEGVPAVLPLPTPHLRRLEPSSSETAGHRIGDEGFETELTRESPFLREGWRLPRGLAGNGLQAGPDGPAPVGGSYAAENVETEYIEPFTALVEAYGAQRRAGEVMQLEAQNARERALAHTFKSVSAAVSSRIPNPSRIPAGDRMHEELGLARAAAQYMRLVFSWRQFTQPEALRAFDAGAAPRIDLDLGAFLESQLVSVELLHVAQLQGLVEGDLLAEATSFVRSSATRLCQNAPWIGPADAKALVWDASPQAVQIAAARSRFLDAVGFQGAGPRVRFVATDGLRIRLPQPKSGLALVLLAFYELLYNALSHNKKAGSHALEIRRMGPHLVLSEGRWTGSLEDLEKGMEEVESFCHRKHRTRFGLKSIAHVLEASGARLCVLETADDFLRIFRNADLSPLFGGWK